MSNRTPEHRLAVAGHCACGTRIVRGTDQHGATATVDIGYPDAADELLAAVAGRPSYVMALSRPIGRGLVLTRRSNHDIAHKPVGFNNDRIVLAHRCPPAERNTP